MVDILAHRAREVSRANVFAFRSPELNDVSRETFLSKTQQ
jgi:hypothetical protein